MNQITQQILKDLENLPPQMQEEALDFVHLLNVKLAKFKSAPLTNEPNGKKVTEIMAEIAARGSAFHNIINPVAWQREIRKDHPLPGSE